MTQALYLEDAYLKEFQATVESIKDGKYAVLNQTAFYAQGGGQPFDTGKWVRLSDHKEFSVVFVGKFNRVISHEINGDGLKAGDTIKGIIDWERRYKLMRSHTAAHILSEIFHREAGALITGNQLDLGQSRIDFSLDNFDKEKISEYVQKANEVVQQDMAVKSYFVSKEEAAKMPRLSKLAIGLPKDIENIRIVAIGDFDRQGDGGTHVKSTKEIGTLELVKAENKGKNNRRVYFQLKESRDKPAIRFD